MKYKVQVSLAIMLSLLLAGAGCSFSAGSVRVGNKDYGSVSYKVGNVNSYASNIILSKLNDDKKIIAETSEFKGKDFIGMDATGFFLKANSKIAVFIKDKTKNEQLGYYEMAIDKDYGETPFSYDYKDTRSAGLPTGDYELHVQIIDPDGKQVGTDSVKEFKVIK